MYNNTSYKYIAIIKFKNFNNKTENLPVSF